MTSHELYSVRRSIKADLRTVSTWITTAQECDVWSGGCATFPIIVNTLVVEIGWDTSESWTLEFDGQIVGFGQLILQSAGRRHLARIITGPDFRGMGYGRRLVSHLVDIALEQCPPVVSLNVHTENVPALNLYRSLGFLPAAKTATHGGTSSVYMERPVSPV